MLTITSRRNRLAWLLVGAAGLVACGDGPGRTGSRSTTWTPGSQQQAISVALDQETTALEARIALLERLGVEGLAVHARVADSQVTLTGEVGRPRALVVAGEAVARLPGISAVHNQVSVDPPPATGPTATTDGHLADELADQLLQARVELRLYEDLGLDAERVHVSTRTGSVWLAGVLPTEDQETSAVISAEATAGAREVVDRIRVR